MRFNFRRYRPILMNSAEEAQIVSVVGDAAIATVGIGHGRLIPLIIIDTINRPDLAEVIEAQVHLPQGDVVVQWARLAKRQDEIALYLRFSTPH